MSQRTPTASPHDRWFVRPRGSAEAPGKPRLICFPHAGGGASAYFAWGAQLPELETLALQLPGRESRLGETPLNDFGQIRAAVTQAVLPLLDRPCAFFGHSMGALLAYEVARELRRLDAPLPRHLYVSGRRSPLVADADAPLHPLPDAEFLDALDRRFGGLPAVIRDEPELRALFLPILRADITALERHRFTLEAPLDVPLTALGGIGDPQGAFDLLAGWGALVTPPVQVQRLAGGHFYLHERRAEFLQSLRSLLAARRWHLDGQEPVNELLAPT